MLHYLDIIGKLDISTENQSLYHEHGKKILNLGVQIRYQEGLWEKEEGSKISFLCIFFIFFLYFSIVTASFNSLDGSEDHVFFLLNFPFLLLYSNSGFPKHSKLFINQFINYFHVSRFYIIVFLSKSFFYFLVLPLHIVAINYVWSSEKH